MWNSALADAGDAPRPSPSSRHSRLAAPAAGPRRARCSARGAAASIGRTWTATPGVSRTSRSTTEPWRSSNQRERVDLPTTSCVARASVGEGLAAHRPPIVAGTVATVARRAGVASVMRRGEPRGARRRRNALRARRFDIHRGPRRAQRVGDALGGAHQPVRAGQLADRDDDPLAARPGARRAPARGHGRASAHRPPAPRGAAPVRAAPTGSTWRRNAPSARVASCGHDRPCPSFSRSISSSGGMSTTSISAVSRMRSGTVSRTRTRVNEATTSLRLSTCWMLIVE